MVRLFGTDGVRGEANTELTPELAYHLGRAATLYFGAQSEVRPRILIGRDTRISGEMFEAALMAGICSAGGVALVVGVVPTPAIAYLAREHKAQAGIVISASHNPFPDNGIKFFGGDGYMRRVQRGRRSGLSSIATICSTNILTMLQVRAQSASTA